MEKEGEMWRSDEQRDSHHLSKAKERRRDRGRGERKQNKQKKQGEEDATAASFVKTFNPGVLSVLLCNR